MALTASKLRENIYKVLDHVLETGTPVEIERRGRKLRIIACDAAASGKLHRLVPEPRAIVGDPEDLVHLDWSESVSNNRFAAAVAQEWGALKPARR